MSNKTLSVAVTGHRPHKLWGYDYNHPKYLALKQRLKELLTELQATQAICGMALGVDTIFALTALELKIPLVAAIPCIGQDSVWPTQSKELYAKILEHPLTTKHLVTNTTYTPSVMQTRNQWMVDHCDHLIAVWNGTAGGTANCVHYARQTNRPITSINPSTISVDWIPN